MITRQQVFTGLKYVVPLVGIVLVIVIFIMPPKLGNETLRGPLSKMLNIDEMYLQMNIPPANGRYPGSILLQPTTGSPLLVRAMSRPAGADSLYISNMTLTSKLSETGEFEYGLDPFSAKSQSRRDLDVTVELTQIRVLEFSGGIGALRESLLTDKDVQRQRSRNQEPEVVVRAIEALPVFTMKRGSNLSAEAWQKEVNNFQTKIGASLDDQGGLRITTPIPVVIAYETQLISYVTDNMAPGAPQKVKLTFVPASKQPTGFAWLPQQINESTSEEAEPLEERRQIGFVTLGTSTYQHAELGDIPAVPNSMQLAEESLLAMGAQRLGAEFITKQRWTKQELLSALHKIVIEAQTKKIDALIVYYVGHSSISDKGHTYLFMSNYNSEIFKVVGGTIDEGLNEDGSAQDVEDMGLMLEGINASTTVADPIENTINVDEIHKLIGEAEELLFAVLIDGCSVRNSESQLNYRLGLDFEPEISDKERRGLLYLLERHGAPISMRNENITILAQRPGVPAITVKHPYWQSMGPDVGPLAASLFSKALEVNVNGSYSYWGDYLNSIVDFEGQGDWGKSGSISWSDFYYWNEIPLK